MNKIKPAIRDTVASLSRATPYFRGKRRLGIMLGKALTDSRDASSCTPVIKMKDSSLMYLDVRSRTEEWSYWTGEYDNKIITAFSNFLNEGSIVLDVGANVGFYTIPLGKKLSALNGQLYAFEPVETNFNRLADNVSLNELSTVVSLHKVALGNEEGTIDMTMESSSNANTGNAVMVSGEVSKDHFNAVSSVPLTQLDTISQTLSIERCDFMKVDIEGAEVMFLKGGKKFIERTRPIVYGEFNSYFLKQFNDSISDVVSIFSPLNYRFFIFKEGSLSEIKQPTEGLENIIFIPSEQVDEALTR